jgi:hypothetical protein
MTGIELPNRDFAQLMNIFHPFRLAPLTGKGPKTDKETREFSHILFSFNFQLISKSERSIVVAWFLWNWAGDAFPRLMAWLGIALK